MVRLVNDSGILETKIDSLDGITFDQLIEAIHAVQTEMKITGTTADEAEGTLAGSVSQLQAAWDNLLTVVAGEGDDNKIKQAEEAFGESVETFLTNLIPKMITTITNGDVLVKALVDSITDLPDHTLQSVTTALLESGARMLGSIEELANWLIDNLADTLTYLSTDTSKIEKFGEALGRLIGNVAENLIENFPAIVEAMVKVGIKLSWSVIKGIWEGLFGSEAGDKLNDINNELEEKIGGTEVAASKAQAILSYMEDLHNKFGDAATETHQWKSAEAELETVLSGSKEVFEQYGDNVEGAITKLKSMSEELRKLAIVNALQDKLNAQYELLGEEYAKKYEAEDKIEMAEYEIAELEKKRKESDLAYAAEYAKLLERQGTPQEVIDEWNRNAGGELYSEDRQAWISYDEATQKELEAQYGRLSELLKIAYNLGYDYEDEYGNKWHKDYTEEDKIWNKEETDYIVSPESYKEIATNMKLYQDEIDKAKTELEEANDGIEKATEQISLTEKAAERAAKELTGLEGSTTSLAVAFSNMRLQISNLGWFAGAPLNAIYNGFGGLISAMGGTPKATGMDFVPYDGFLAELHRGEAIITKDENAKRHSGADYMDMETALEAAIERSMSRMYLNMNGEKVGDITTRRTEKNISAAERSRTRSMGG